MANRKVIFDIEANDKSGKAINSSKSALDKLKTNFSQLTGVSLGAAGAIGAAGFAVQKLMQFVNSAISGTEQYVTSIADMSRVLGISTEDTSKLVQASDDLFVSQEKLNAALLAASRQGIDVSISGLKDLSEQYLKLNPGVDRAEFLMKRFGRSGADMGKLMEIGSDGIDEATTAIAKNLIVTEQSRINIENYKRSVDNLNDTWEGFKFTIGNAVIPQLDLLMRQMTKGVDPIEETELAVNELNQQIMYLEKYAGMAGLSQEEMAKQVSAAREEINQLTTATNTQIESQQFLESSVIATTSYFKALTTEMVFNLAATGLDSEAALALAESMGLVDNATRAQIEAIQLLREQYADTGNLDAYIGKMGSLAKMLSYINSMSNVNINWGGSGYGGYGTSDVNYQNTGNMSQSVYSGTTNKNSTIVNNITLNANGVSNPSQILKEISQKVKQQGGLPQ